MQSTFWMTAQETEDEIKRREHVHEQIRPAITSALFGEVTDVLGNSKPVVKFWPDGSFECPHCAYPVRADEGLSLEKHNPWCLAHPGYPVDKAKQVIAERERKAAEEAERRRNHAAAMERMRQEKERRQQRESQQIADAKERGQCVACLIRSGFRKTVKHRTVCPLSA